MSYPTTPQHPEQPAPYQGAPVPPQQPVQPPSYPAQPVAARPAQPTTLAHTNTFALVAVILAFIQPIAGIVFGHMALSQIKRNGDAGRGLALTGLVLGYVYIAFIVLFVIFYVSMIALMIGSLGAAFSDMGNYDYSY